MQQASRYPVLPLRPNHNCWRIAHADRLAFLIDGAAYFEAFREAVKKAKRSILIVGWDIDSRVKLVRDRAPDDLPLELGDFLDAAVRRRPGLHAHVLSWDFAAVYMFEREAMPRYKLQWLTHRRFHFRLDNTHPPNGCHHQKIVVIDDGLAFVGGLDLTDYRWDTPQHRPRDPRRLDTAGNPYPPFHDVQMMVDGAAAAALAELVRERWRQASGERLHPVRMDNNPWPDAIQPDITDIGVAIARTEPAYNDKPGIREVEQLYLDAIGAARDSIYIENQYLTSATVGAALSRRLQEKQGPEILLVLPCQTSGWLEQATMDVLRARLLKQIRQADRYGRLRVCYPDIPGLGDECVNVHAKVLIVDDWLVRIGSANLSNRSMGLDTECDLAVEADGSETVRKAIAGLRHRLLGHHLGIKPEQIAQAEARQRSLFAALDSLRGRKRTLKEFDPTVADVLDSVIPDAAVIDPQEPLALEQLLTSPEPGGNSAALAQLSRSLRDGTLFGLGLALRWTSLDNWLKGGLKHLARWFDTINQRLRG